MISIISMFVVAIGTMALIIVLSVFNGLEGVLRSLYGTIDPNLVINAAVGKTFVYTEDLQSRIGKVEGIVSVTEVLEDNALIGYNNAQRVATVKGVSNNFIEQGRLQDYMVYGDLKFYEDQIPYAIVGRGVQYDLSVNPKSDFHTLQIHYPDELRPGVMNPEKMDRLRSILPGGIFAVEKSYDDNLVFVPLAFAEDLFNKKGRRSALELELVPNANVTEIKSALMHILGTDFIVQSNAEIHGDLFRILSYEKFFVFLALSTIIGIASINIFFSLSMLALDKKKDVAVLTALGASSTLIRNIFLLEGCIVAFTGAFTGLGLGLLITYLQQEFGFVTMGMETAIIDAYPVKVVWSDIGYTILTIILITILTTIKPALDAARRPILSELQ